MWYVERGDEQGDWKLMMASPHRVGINDLHGPPSPAYNNQTFGGDLYGGLPTPGNLTCFSGERGWHARVRHNDTLVEFFDWDKVMENPNDPGSDYKWGWTMKTQNYDCVPYEQLWPQQFVG